MKVSGKTTRFADCLLACLISLTAFCVVCSAERKIGETWQIAALSFVAALIVIFLNLGRNECIRSLTRLDVET